MQRSEIASNQCKRKHTFVSSVAISALLALATQLVLPLAPAHAIETWEKLDKRLKQQVYQLNVGLKLHTKDGTIYLADLSPKYHYPVFRVSQEDQGYYVIGLGSSFPIRTAQHDKTYFVTNKHVVDSADKIEKECQRFFAALRLYAEQTAEGNAEARYKQLVQIVNLCSKGKQMTASERSVYQPTVDMIWDVYDNYLSLRTDPGRVLFTKFSKLSEVESQVSYFLHPAGPASQQPLEAKLFKMAQKDSEPDLALLSVTGSAAIPLDFETIDATEGQEIQVIGYPLASDVLDTESAKYYAPTFSTGRISRVTPHVLQVDAPITKGNSGGPVVSLRGKVLGVVATRAIASDGSELPNYGGAITRQAVQAFAPELFGSLKNQ